VSPAFTDDPEAELMEVQAFAQLVPLFAPVAVLSTYQVAAFAENNTNENTDTKNLTTSFLIFELIPTSEATTFQLLRKGQPREKRLFIICTLRLFSRIDATAFRNSLNQNFA
jgi:hypothetical protein